MPDTTAQAHVCPGMLCVDWPAMLTVDDDEPSSIVRCAQAGALHAKATANAAAIKKTIPLAQTGMLIPFTVISQAKMKRTN